MGPGRSSSVLRIGSNPIEAPGSGRKGGEFGSLAVVVHWVTPEEPLFPKGKIREIRYPSSSEYLRVAI